MITVKTLKKLLKKIPDDAKVNAYEGEDVGFSIETNDQYWWIRANKNKKEEDIYTEGFNKVLKP